MIAAALCLVASPEAISSELVPFELPPLPGHTSAQAWGINDHYVVGSSGTWPDQVPVRWDRRGFIRELEVPAGVAGCSAFAINFKGVIVGQCNDGVAVMWDRSGDVLRRLPPLPADWNSSAQAIDHKGRTVGSSQGPNGTSAVIWGKSGEPRLLRPPELREVYPEEPGTNAYAINNSGLIAGNSDDDPIVWRAKRKTPELRDVPEGKTNGRIFGLSDSGLAVGRTYPYHDYAEGSDAAVWSRRNQVSELPVPFGYLGAEARGVNNRGRVIGSAFDPGGLVNPEDHRVHTAVIWISRRPQELYPLPGDCCSEARAINRKGEVVGRSFSSEPGNRAVVWRKAAPGS